MKKWFLAFLFLSGFANAQVVINEVRVNDGEGDSFVELKNTSSTPADLSGWWLCDAPAYGQLGEGRTIPGGGIVTVVLNRTGTDSETEWFLSRTLTLSAADGEVGLYENGSFASNTDIRAYMQWGGSHVRAPVAVSAGLWSASGDSVDPPGQGESMSLQANDGAPFSPQDYSIGAPSQGDENPLPDIPDSDEDDHLPATHVAILTEDEVVDVARGISLFGGIGGSAWFSYNSVSRELDYVILHNIGGADKISLHGPAQPGDSGPELYDLGAVSPANGTLNLSESEADDLLAGLLFIQVSTGGLGDVRGQITGKTALGATFTSESSATGRAALTYDTVTRTLRFLVIHNVDSPTSAHIHGPATPEQTGPVIFGLTASPLAIKGEVILDAKQEADMLAGLWYFNIHSNAFPSGELRGQIEQLEIFAAPLSAQQVPNSKSGAIGLGLFLYRQSQMTLDVLAGHNVASPDQVDIHEKGPVGLLGEKVFMLGDATAPVTASLDLSNEQEADLNASNLKLNITSNALPDGEIRGTIRPLSDISTLLTNYLSELAAWGTDAVSSCFGTTPTVQDLILLIDNNLECPVD